MGGLVSTLMAVLCIVTGESTGGTGGNPAIMVADFDYSVRTAQGGLFYCMGGRPDRVRDELVTIGEPPCGAWRIEVSADAPTEGVGGVVPLFDNRTWSPKPQPLNIGDATHLDIRLVGALGARRLRVELVSGEAIQPDQPGELVTTVAASELDATQWRAKRFVLPTGSPDRSAFAAVRLLLEGEGPAWLAVDSMAFTNGATAAARQTDSAPHPLRQCLWVWKTKEILPDPARVEALLACCKRNGITDLFCQVPYKRVDGEVRLQLVDQQRAFNSAARRAGVTVHALDGDPKFVFKANHPRVFEFVEALDRFNRESPPEDRYRAVHMDNEPYVNEQWKQGPEAQQEVIRDYLELNRELRRRVNAAGMEYGVDIPFWWDKPDASGQPAYRVTIGDREVPLLEALFPYLQNAGIMSYRTRVTGPNGIVGCCLTEFELGARFGVQVFASVELGTGPRVEEGITFGVYPAEYFAAQLKTLQRVLAHEEGCSGIAIHAYQFFSKLQEVPL
jgi:hypothetical protein